MLHRLVALSLRFPLVVGVVVAIVVAVGLDSARRLPIDAVPDITNVQVQVLGTAPALGPVDVETAITAPVEAALGGLPGVSEVRSLSRAGLAAITVVFHDDVDLLLARQLVNERVTAVRNDLAASGNNSVDIELGPLSTGLGEVLQFEVTSTSGHSLMQLRGMLDGIVAPELRTVAGVAEINAFGGEWMTWEVELDAAKLRAAGVDVGDVYRALEREHGTAGGGSIARAGEQWLVRGDARFDSLDDVGDVVVVKDGGASVQLIDLGRVHEAPLLRHGAVTRDGRGEAVTGIVMMLVGENGGDVVARVKERLTTVQAALPQGVGIDVFYDRSTLVQRTIRTVATNLVEGAVFVVLVLLLLLGNLRAGVVVAIAIPLSMLVAFIGMRALGLSGNLMSLGALDFGIVVDGSVIVVEAALVALAAAQARKGGALSYVDASDVVVDVSRQLSRSTVYGGLILALVYVPVLTLSGVEGRMFKPMALAVLFALLGAVVVSLTVVPVLTAWLLRNTSGNDVDAAHREPKLVIWLRRAYTPALDAAVAFPKRVVVVAVVAVVVAVVLLTRLGGAFMPRLDEGAIAVQLMRLPSVSLPESIAGATRFEQLAKAQNDVDTVVCKTGRAEVATDPMGIELSDCLVMLRPGTATARAAEIVSALQSSSTTVLPDLGLAFSQPIELRMAELISGSRADVGVTLFGDDLADLERASELVQAALERVPGADDVRGEHLAGVATVDITVDRAKAAAADVDSGAVLDVVDAVGGRVVAEVRRGQRVIPVQVRFSERDRADVADLAVLPVESARGARELGDVAGIAVVDAPASINRSGLRRRTIVEVNVRDRDLAGFVVEAKGVVSSLPMPAGVVVRWGGQYEQLEAARARLAVAVPLALAVIFVLLLLACGSASTATTVFLNVPLAAVGGVVALWLRGIELSVSAGVGFIAVFGVAVLNGLVLMTSIEDVMSAGDDGDGDGDVVTAVKTAAATRLRPVVTTAAVAILGFVPMALSTSAGAEVQRPLATVVIGGLLSSTALTLLVLPAIAVWRRRR